jgi:hypothetical protein
MLRGSLEKKERRIMDIPMLHSTSRDAGYFDVHNCMTVLVNCSAINKSPLGIRKPVNDLWTPPLWAQR